MQHAHAGDEILSYRAENALRVLTTHTTCLFHCCLARGTMADGVATAEVVGVVGPDDVVAAPQLSLGERVQAMQNELDLPEFIVKDLLSVSGNDIVVIADDSGSMNAVSDFKTHTTRWDELRKTLTSLAKMLLVVDHSDGFNVSFLNGQRGDGGAWHTIHRPEDVNALFRSFYPGGKTPLLSRIRPVLSGEWHPKGHGGETEVLLIIMTDGEPSDCTFEQLRDAVRAKKGNCYVSFLMCTDEDDIVAKYNKYLDRIPGVDITDDYLSEKGEAERHGKNLGYFKWLAKMVLGGKLPQYDKLDEADKCKCVIS